MLANMLLYILLLALKLAKKSNRIGQLEDNQVRNLTPHLSAVDVTCEVLTDTVSERITIACI